MFSDKVNDIKYVLALVRLPSSWDFPKIHGCVVQLVNPNKVLGKKHLLHCILLTERAFKKGRNIASSPDIEFLLRLSGTRQIDKAIKQMSPKKEALVVVFGKNAGECYKKAKEQVGWSEIKRLELKSQPGEKDAMERASLLDLF